MTAQAVEPAPTMACTGWAEGPIQEHPVSMGLVVDVAKRTIHGFREWSKQDGQEAELTITEVKEAILVLRGQTGGQWKNGSASGFMDRMSGDMTVTVIYDIGLTVTYRLKCRPAQRMF